ncbi:MAG: inositol monophosphatase [Deltaproteobacteria bacterium]|nr:inositol monophosphatase [Deltaproteobacteria bacterium]
MIARNPLTSRFELAQAVVREVGSLARSLRQSSLVVSEKGKQDWVTNADLAVEARLLEAIRGAFPCDAILAEETLGTAEEGERLWIIDPIDGTTNFAEGLDLWAISVGFAMKGRIEFGVIYAPDRDEFYVAARGEGASLNGVPMKVGDAAEHHSLILLGRSNRTDHAAYLDLVDRIARSDHDYRRLGSAALSLALVARGLAGAYYEAHLNSWDFAAGLVICDEAGCRSAFAEVDLARGGPVLVARPGFLGHAQALVNPDTGSS